AAASALGAGDGMLIEQHTPGPGTGLSCPCNCSQWEYVPMEYYQESFDAIRRATARGIIVVEAAANGSQDLDRSIFGGRFNRALRDSQAILVGASGAGDGMVACFSSSAHRIDVYAWGGGVVTLGYGDGASAPPPFNNTAIPRHYTGGFGGTSSASAIVAGAVISVQGARLGQDCQGSCPARCAIFWCQPERRSRTLPQSSRRVPLACNLICGALSSAVCFPSHPAPARWLD